MSLHAENLVDCGRLVCWIGGDECIVGSCKCQQQIRILTDILSGVRFGSGLVRARIESEQSV